MDVKDFQQLVKNGDLAAVKAALRDQPALLDATNEAGQSGFILAMYYRQREVADYLLSLGPQLDVFNACIAGETERVLHDVRSNPDLLDAQSSDGWTPLHLAAFFGHADLAEALIDQGAKVDAKSSNAMRNTPLHAAAAGGQIGVMELLLKRGANANATQEGGDWTALHSAAQAGNRQMVEVLVANGAHVNARAANGQSALDLALSKGHHEVAELLEHLGAKLQS
ncbi:MAG TPA: ankyrin repeat domain-containing protein [Bryobacteraceae bacterium]|jgi:ankyrin repeat protein|nr:ankyrin repeat domain-containing protein [Bryobacteraceae bacterium]